MHDTAVVTAISKDGVTVIPLITNACLSCKEGCAKRGHPFSALNSKNLPVKIGSIVKIGTFKKNEVLQGLFSLVFPILCAAAGYFAATPAAGAFGIQVSEGLQALFVLLGLALSTMLVFLLSRNMIHLIRPEIIELCI